LDNFLAAGILPVSAIRDLGFYIQGINICHGYVEAQNEYALPKRDGYDVNQYTQHVISTPGKQDGLALQNPNGTWGGPVGEKIASAIVPFFSKLRFSHLFSFTRRR
jgi:Protein of unknown function (DUF2950)